MLFFPLSFQSKAGDILLSLSSAEAPAGHPNKNSNTSKNRKRPSHRAPRDFLFFLSTSLRRKEASAEERVTSGIPFRHNYDSVCHRNKYGHITAVNFNNFS